MSTNPNEEVPMMPDVRAVRREAWQRTAILRWPFHLIFAVMLSVITPLWFSGVLTGKWGALFPLVMGLWGIAVGLFPRQILRAFCGSKTPMVYARGDTGFIQSGAGARFRYIAIVIGGGVIGLLAAIVLQQPGVDALFGRLLAILLGLVIVATGLSYARTRLWESIFSIAVQAVMMAIVLGAGSIEEMVPWVLLCATLWSYVFAISFFLRWRRWVQSLPDTAKTEEA
jgi:hypothetical protein